jgi:transcriptional antiterminator NusG
MSNTYALNTTRGKEFEVEGELTAMGLKPWTPRRLDSRYVKEKREAVWYDRPYVPKLLFCVVPAVYWRDVHDLKHVIGKPIGLSRLDIEGMPAGRIQTPEGGFATRPARFGLRDFQAAVEGEYADAKRARSNSEYQCQFQPGEALDLLAGAFEGFPAVFRDVICHAHDEYAKLRVEIELFGRAVPVEVDPDHVKGAA